MQEPIFAGAPFGRRDAVATGCADEQLRTMVRLGQVRRLLQGVYVDARVPDSLGLRAAAVSLVTPADAVLCRVTAAWLHGIDLLVVNDHLAVPPVQTLVPATRAATRRTGCAGFSAMVEEDEIVEVAGIRVTSPVRTTLDLARWLARPDALAYVDAMLHAGLVTLPDLEAALPRVKHQPWVEQGREMVALAEPAAESGMETRMRLRYLDAGFPRPEVQIEVRDGTGAVVVRLDCGLASRLFGFEYDGEEYHGPEQAAHDASRRAWLERRGWTIRVFRKEHVLGRGPAFELAVGEVLGLEPRIRTLEARQRTRSRQRLTRQDP